jgi:chromate reductase
LPGPVAALKSAIDAADALLIATPEYNGSIPGVLANALDWASRPSGASVLREKPAAVMGATPAGLGTAQAQAIVRHVLAASHAYVLPTPRVHVSHAHVLFGADGALLDDEARRHVAALVEALVAWAERVGSGSSALSRASR